MMQFVPNRHKHDDEMGDMSSVNVKPACIICFDKDPDEAPGDETKQKRDSVVASLKTCGLQVTTSESRDNDEVFVRISASEQLLQNEAEAMEMKLRLKQKYGGGWHPFSRRLLPLFEHSSEGTLFSSLQQCRIIERHVKMTKNDGGAALVFEELEDCGFTSFFYMHYEPTRAYLMLTWGKAWSSSQPIELIREYFGEKIALYFNWIGFYTESLWIPAMVGILVMITQIYTSAYTGSLDNPWVPLYCIFTALWAVYFLEGWKRIENSRKMDWETMDFEEQEEERDEFEGELRISDITGEEEKFYPEWKRGLKIAFSVAVVISFIMAVIFTVSGIMVFKMLAKRWYGAIGAPLGGVTNALSIMVFNVIYGKVVEKLTNMENWRTATEWEDSLIAKDFVFKFVNAYFALFFVAFVQNNIDVYGHDLHCKEYHCMPVLTMTLGIVFGTQIFVQQSMEIGMPIIKAKMRDYLERRKLKKMGKEIKELTAEESQSKLETYEGTFDDYQEMVVQFGYVTLFAAAFPLTATLALLNNIVEIRVDALKVLGATRRPSYMCAADIGTWQTILDILATAAILTNVCLVGFTSHGLYLYFPNMTHADRIWITIIAEHALLLFKIVVEAAIPDVPKDKEDAYKKSCVLRDRAVAKFKNAPEQLSAGAAFTDTGY